VTIDSSVGSPGALEGIVTLLNSDICQTGWLSGTPSLFRGHFMTLGGMSELELVASFRHELIASFANGPNLL
jgi:hypothetical protein